MTGRERELELQDALHELAMSVLHFSELAVPLTVRVDITEETRARIEAARKAREEMVERAKSALVVSCGG